MNEDVHGESVKSRSFITVGYAPFAHPSPGEVMLQSVNDLEGNDVHVCVGRRTRTHGHKSGNIFLHLEHVDEVSPGSSSRPVT